MRIILFIISCCLFVYSCTAGSGRLRDVDNIIDISTVNKKKPVTFDNAREIIDKFSSSFQIPNPLYGSNESITRKADPNHENIILCKATLLDDFSTEADILNQCRKDSLDEQSCHELRERYVGQYIRNGMFRIRISLESGFSAKSMEPDLWAMYIENSSGIMIEPSDITVSEITALEDTVYSDYHVIHLQRNVMLRDITLYFKRTTFFGEDLFGKGNPYIVLVMSHKRKTVARIAWNISGSLNN